MIQDPDIHADDLLRIPTDKVAVLHDMNLKDLAVRRKLGHLRIDDSRRYFFLHKTCLRIAESFTRFTIHTLWDLYRRVNIQPYSAKSTLMKGILEIGRSIDGSVDPWFALDDHFTPLLYASQRSPDPKSALRDPFLNNADLWVFTAPDRFPIQEGFTHRLSSFPKRSSGHLNSFPPFFVLPVELLGQIISILSTSDTLSLLGTSNAVRASLLPAVDWRAKHDIYSNYPWMVAYGEKETKAWSYSGPEQSFPWFAYRLAACKRHSYSMRNRHHIWKILKQMEALGEDKGILSRDMGRMTCDD